MTIVRAQASSDRRVALVLGAGGIIGFSYIVGALAALEEHAGLDAREADLIVGTSAGSVAGALLRSGVAASHLYRLTSGAGVPVDDLILGPGADRAFVRAFSDPVTLLRRGVGSGLALARAFRWPLPPIPPPRALRRLFPAGLFTFAPLLQALSPVLPTEWPTRPLFVCATDLDTRRRAVFGTPSGPEASPAEAVQASCAIPGFYETVEIGGREYVDGGVLSSTHLDLAAGYDLVVGVAPMTYDRHSARPSLHPARLAMEIYRRYPSRSLRTETRAVREAGSRVLLIRPSVAEAEQHGFNLMDPRDRDAVADTAYDAVVRSLATARFTSTLAPFGYGLATAAAAASPA